MPSQSLLLLADQLLDGIIGHFNVPMDNTMLVQKFECRKKLKEYAFYLGLLPIGYLESTTNRIDANVDQVLDIIKQNFSNKSPRFEDSMHCDSEDFPTLHSHSSTPGKH